MRHLTPTLCLLVFLSTAACAQPEPLARPADEQIAAAVSAAPEEDRAGARVLGYTASGELVELRPGTNDMVCLGDDPTDDRWHVACYHESLEPFMARGRALRAEGHSRDEVNAVREEEARAGTLPMPQQSAALYQLSGSPEAFDYVSGKVVEASPLYVVYIPYATEETTGLSTKPITRGAPWIMDPGKPWSHIMIVAPTPRIDD